MSTACRGGTSWPNRPASSGGRPARREPPAAGPSCRDFFVIADFAPLADAHVLLIPRTHHLCLAALPPELDAEFEDLKDLMGRFVKHQYGALAYWENGIFGQSVPHAHLHALSWSIDVALYRNAGPPFSAISGLRQRRSERPGPYFTVEHEGEARFLPPDLQVSRPILAYARERHGGISKLTRDGRRAEGLPLIVEMKRRWEAQALR